MEDLSDDFLSGLERVSRWFERIFAPITRAAAKLSLSPYLFTALAVFGGLLAGWATSQLNAGLVLVGLLVRLGSSQLHLAVGRARGLPANKARFWVNEAGERASDWLALGGLFFVPGVLANSAQFLMVALAWLAAAAPTVASLLRYPKLGERISGGPMGKNERGLVLFLAVAFLQLGAGQAVVMTGVGLTIALGAAMTALIRTIKLI